MPWSAHATSVAEVTGGSTHLLDLFVAEGQAALAEDAEVIVLGCAGLADLVGPLSSAFPSSRAWRPP